MKDVQKQLLAISTALSSLVQKVEKIVEAVETGSGKAVPAKKKTGAKKAKAPAKKAKAVKKRAKRTVKKPKAAPKKNRAARKPAPAASQDATPASSGGESMLDNIFGMISRSRSGITVDRLKKRTGLEARQVSNALYKLTKKGKIQTLSRGVYVKKKI